MLSLITSLIEGTSSYFSNRQEIKKVEEAGTLAIKKSEIDAKVAINKAKLKLAEAGQISEADLDKRAVEDMKSSYKDEYLLALFSIPMILAFIPDYADIALKGFSVIDTMPDWYKYIFIGMIIVIFGMRGMLTKFLTSMKLK